MAVEELLKDAVCAEYVGRLALQAVLEHARIAKDAAERAAALADLELEEAIVQHSASRLPATVRQACWGKVAATVRLSAAGGSAFQLVRVVRYALAGLLRRDVEAIVSAVRSGQRASARPAAHRTPGCVSAPCRSLGDRRLR
ncbi:hypothetical protein ACFU9Y_22680 [Streptomyces sp. NPDC057621]|uniref:hypothetical protein n=1 Tax=Streptomyces sp. NPDC057621 TaxID=3346186 RepID=UPI0036C38670